MSAREKVKTRIIHFTQKPRYGGMPHSCLLSSMLKLPAVVMDPGAHYCGWTNTISFALYGETAPLNPFYTTTFILDPNPSRQVWSSPGKYQHIYVMPVICKVGAHYRTATTLVKKHSFPIS